MNKKLITTIGLIPVTIMFVGIGIVIPELSVGIGSLVMGGVSVRFALQVLKESTKRKVDRLILQELITKLQLNSKSYITSKCMNTISPFLA